MHRVMVTASEHQQARDDHHSNHRHPGSRQTWQQRLRSVRQSILGLGSSNRGGSHASWLAPWQHLAMPQQVVTTAVALLQQWLQRICSAARLVAAAWLLVPLVVGGLLVAYLAASGDDGSGMMPFAQLTSDWWPSKRQHEFVSGWE